jgi:hypothetical protein
LWKELDLKEQLMYLGQAEYLIEKSYFTISVDKWELAEKLWRKKVENRE